MTFSPDTPDFADELTAAFGADIEIAPPNMQRIISLLGGIAVPPLIDRALGQEILDTAYHSYRLAVLETDVETVIDTVQRHAQGASFYAIADRMGLARSTPNQRFSRFCRALASNQAGPEYFRTMYPEVYAGLQLMETGKGGRANQPHQDGERQAEPVPPQREASLKGLLSNLGLSEQNVGVMNRYFFLNRDELSTDVFGPADRIALRQTIEAIRDVITQTVRDSANVQPFLTVQDFHLFGVLIGNGRTPTLQYSLLLENEALLKKLGIEKPDDLLPAVQTALSHLIVQIRNRPGTAH